MSLFSLPVGPTAPSHGVSSMFYSKVEPNQPIRQDNGFGSQRIQFTLNPAANQWFLPSRSYYRVRVNLSVRNGDDSGYVSVGRPVGNGPTDAKYPLAPAFGMCSKLFSQAAFQVGSTTVCSVSSNLPQVDALHKRSTLSRTQLASSEGLYQASRTDRIQQFLGASAGASDTESYELIWSPPLGISDVQHALPASQYLYTFVANPNFARDGVDGQDLAERVPDTGVGTTTNGYRLTVESMVFYACYATGRDGSDEKYSLNLRQLSCQALGMSTASNALQLRNFDTSQDTTALVLAFQDSAEGNRYGGKSVFTIGIGDQTDLKRWYVSYDNTVYPQEQNEDIKTDNQNWITQRWRDSASQTGLYFSPGGPEFLDAWLKESGPYYFVNWPRIQGSATRVQVNAELSSANPFDCLLLSVSDQSFLVRSSDARVKKVELAE